MRLMYSEQPRASDCPAIGSRWQHVRNRGMRCSGSQRQPKSGKRVSPMHAHHAGYLGSREGDNVLISSCTFRSVVRGTPPGGSLRTVSGNGSACGGW